MDFVDEVKLEVVGGDGGNGVASFRREKFVPNGGPNGGDGGAGGSVIFVADSNVGTLMDLRYKKRIAARRGTNGQGNDKYGRKGESITVQVPVGTAVFDAQSGEQLADLVESGQQMIAAAGGQGGLGNIHFATSTNRAPKQFTHGSPGEQRKLRLELKLLADIGLVGYPSVGKSTLISKLSAAKPKIAAYPFTTLVPNLGVCQISYDQQFVIADIPGIIEHASEGAGLGIRFLKHIQRTAALVYLVALNETLENDLIADLKVLQHELESFEEGLSKRGSLVVVNKADIPDTLEQQEALTQALNDMGMEVMFISAVTGEGIDALKYRLADFVLNKDQEISAE